MSIQPDNRSYRIVRDIETLIRKIARENQIKQSQMDLKLFQRCLYIDRVLREERDLREMRITGYQMVIKAILSYNRAVWDNVDRKVR